MVKLLHHYETASSIYLLLEYVTGGTILDALKAELRKLGQSDTAISHIVSSTSDGASSQLKFNRLLEKESGKSQGTIVENKCAMHLGVNLRHAQVKAMEGIELTDDYMTVNAVWMNS